MDNNFSIAAVPERWSACHHEGRIRDAQYTWLYYVEEHCTDYGCLGHTSKADARACARSRNWNGIVKHDHPEFGDLVFQVRPKTFKYTVIGYYRDSGQRYADTFRTQTPEIAEDRAIARALEVGADLVIAAVAKGTLDLVA